MKASYDEELAIHIRIDPYADDGNVEGVASVRGTGRQRHGEQSSGTAES